jgi:glycosyltransferase involved in cell wall biosynthesis
MSSGLAQLGDAARSLDGRTVRETQGSGVRVVLDVRALQEPDRAPTTAAYLEALLEAFDAQPQAGESFAFLLQSDLDDPTLRFERLAVVGRRLLPPTRLLRSGALTIDPFLVGGASLGAAWRADRGGAAGAVYHAAAGALPMFSQVPTVVTLLDLAPWELPQTYQRGFAARFGQRLRAQLLRESAAVIVGSQAIAASARRLLHLRRDRVHVVDLAPRLVFARVALSASTPNVAAGRSSSGEAGAAVKVERDRLGLPERYLVYSGRYDARQDLDTLLSALAELGAAGRPFGLAEDISWPPRVLLVGASPDDRASLARVAAREGVGDALAYAPRLEPDRLAALIVGARAAILPVVSDASGLAAIEAIACGTPVIASSIGALPEIVGSAGILVEPRDPRRLAAAIATSWSDELVYAHLAEAARARSIGGRTWADVARETRTVYAQVGSYR